MLSFAMFLGLSVGSENDLVFGSMLEANLATEVGMIVLDMVGLYMSTFTEQLSANHGANPLMKKMFDINLYFLQVPQSETLLKHVFAMWRCIITKFPSVLFDGSADYCSRLTFELLRCCNSKLSSTRHESTALLYLLMRGNFEYTQRKGITRVHLQVRGY